MDLSRRELTKTAVLGSLAIGAGGLLSACGSSSSSGSPQVAATGKPKKGGTPRAAITGGTTSDTLNPLGAINNADFARVNNLFEPLVGLTPQAQPVFILAEELTPNSSATSALDVSVQAAIVELLRRLQAERGLSLLFITHNLPLVRSVADDVVVMHDGKICERGGVSDVLEAPKDAYNVQLLTGAPKMAVAVGDG